MAKKRDLTIAEYLAHMGRSVIEANLEAIKATRDILASDQLDTTVTICDNEVRLDGTVLAPQGWIGLDRFEIECESEVYPVHDENGEPAGLAMPMKRRLFRHGMHVKFKASFSRSGTIEGIEILRDAGNNSLRQVLASLPLKTHIAEKGE